MKLGTLSSAVVSVSLIAISLIQSGAADAVGSTWTPPMAISTPGQSSSSPTIASDPLGNLTAVWSSFDGSNEVIQTASKSVGGEWSNPTTISTAGSNADAAQVTIDSAGNATAVWMWSNPSLTTVIQAATKPVGGTWSNPTTISDSSHGALEVPHIVADGAGTVTAVWKWNDGFTDVIQSANLPLGGSWAPPSTISTTDGPSWNVRIASDPAGDLTVVWMHWVGIYLVQAVVQPSGGSWSVPTTISDPNVDAWEGAIAMDASGNATAVWKEQGNTSILLRTASLPLGGTWNIPMTLSADGGNAAEPRVAADAAGNVVAAWTRYDGTNWIVQTDFKPINANWTSPVDVSPAGTTSGDPCVVSNGVGGFTTSWTRTIGSTQIVETSALASEGTWSTAYQLNAQGEIANTARLVSNPAGDLFAVWLAHAENETTWQVQTSSNIVPRVQPDNELASTGFDAWPMLVGVTSIVLGGLVLLVRRRVIRD